MDKRTSGTVQSIRIVILILITLFVLMLGAHFALAGWKPEYAQLYTPQERQWFKEQKVPGGPFTGQSCCDVADGSLVQEDIKDGQYWVRCPLDSPCPLKQWTQVPDDRVLKTPNRFGRPVVWFTYVDGNPVIRCYAPGAGL